MTATRADFPGWPKAVANLLDNVESKARATMAAMEARYPWVVKANAEHRLRTHAELARGPLTKAQRTRRRIVFKYRYNVIAIDQIARARRSLRGNPRAAKAAYHGMQAQALTLARDAAAQKAYLERVQQQSPLSALADVNDRKKREAAPRASRLREIAQQVSPRTFAAAHTEYLRRYPHDPISYKTATRYLRA